MTETNKLLRTTDRPVFYATLTNSGGSPNDMITMQPVINDGFTMSLSDRVVQVPKPGRYRFKLYAMPRIVSTSGTAAIGIAVMRNEDTASSGPNMIIRANRNRYEATDSLRYHLSAEVFFDVIVNDLIVLMYTGSSTQNISDVGTDSSKSTNHCFIIIYEGPTP